MQRKLISEAGGKTFFEKLRNGFVAVQDEVAKVEQLTEGPSLENEFQKLETTYFEGDIELLRNMYSVYEETLTLHTTLTERPVHINPIEERLKKIREKLLKFEEAPALLKKGYQPYIPEEVSTDEPNNVSKDLASEVQEDDEDSQVVETQLSFASPSFEQTGNGNVPQTPLCTPLDAKKRQRKQNKNKNLSVSKADLANNNSPVLKNGSSSKKTLPSETKLLNSTQTTVLFSSSADDVQKTQPVIVNAKLANCLNILNRWNTVEAGHVKVENGTKLPKSETCLKTSPSDTLSLQSKLPPASSTKADHQKVLSDQVFSSKTDLLRTPKTTVLSAAADSVKMSLRSSKLSTPGAQLINTVASHSINRSKTFTMEAKPKQFAKPTVPIVVEYETVEFTPGMTSKVRKYT